MIVRFYCKICNSLIVAEPPNLAVCEKCRAKYLFKYSKFRVKGEIKGHYIYAGFK